MKAAVMDVVGQHFRPEFINRVDDMVVFHPLDREQIKLIAGIQLGHLRKRLENAVRAYISVQVHCRGWDLDRVHSFAVERGVLPPQFADNLWHRALLTPIQLPSYFVGFRIFDAAWHNERDRLGTEFNAKAFNDAVLASGGVPMDLLDEVLDERPR